MSSASAWRSKAISINTIPSRCLESRPSNGERSNRHPKPTAPVVLGFGYLRNYIGLNQPTPSAGIRVLTFNVKYFDQYRLKLETQEARQQRVDEDLTFIGDSNPDIFCGQDFCPEDLTDDQLFEKVRAHTGLIYKTKDLGDSIVFSKYPIVNQGTRLFDETKNSFCWADAQYPGRTIRVFTSLTISTASLQALVTCGRFVRGYGTA